MSLNSIYNSIFFSLFFLINELYNQTLVYFFLGETDYKLWEVRFSTFQEVFFFENVITIVSTCYMISFVFFLKLFLFPLQNFFYFELDWIKNLIFNSALKGLALIFISHCIYFFFILPIEHSWSNETFYFSPFLTNFIKNYLKLNVFLLILYFLLPKYAVNLFFIMFLWDFVAFILPYSIFNYFDHLLINDQQSK